MNIIKSILSKININYLLVGAIIFLSSFSVYQKQRADKAEKDVETYQVLSRTLINSYGNKLNQYDNKLGKLVASVDAISARESTFKDIVSDMHDLRSSFDGVKRNLRNVDQVMNAGFAATKEFIAEGKVDTTYVIGSDTTQAWTFKEGDPFFSIEGIVVPSYKRVIAKPSLTGDFTGILIEKRAEPKRRFLGIGIGRKTEKFELTSTNPYITIDSLAFIKK